MSTVNTSVAKLRELAPTLNKAADDAAKIVQEVENVLTKELSLGIEVSVNVHYTNLSKTKTERTNLAHCRVNGKFRIAVVVEHEVEFASSSGHEDVACETVSETPWAECPRDVKLETFPALPKLLEEITRKVEETGEKVRKTEQTVREILGKPDNQTIPVKQEPAKFVRPQ